MKKRIISLLLAAVLAASLCACGEQQAADGGSLRLYCPADLSEQNKSAGGGDAVQGIAIPWADITAVQPPSSSSMMYCACCWAAARRRGSSRPYPWGRSC